MERKKRPGKKGTRKLQTTRTLVYVIIEITEVVHDPLDNRTLGRAKEDKGRTIDEEEYLLKREN